ncbi:hypothetical protein [Candidatus Frankia alpina]|uniref:Uncharacterized protein n=1 Tax=Candidatus Frankia alpina TaxID=2699483 RepID=A0A4S5EG76_9ACTN|nr:hypothetical protein [Candidatus Frankia alpina]THJ70988.1 hypothetical protein E7Y31_15560 [Candidatus Frankia alpina]
MRSMDRMRALGGIPARARLAGRGAADGPLPTTPGLGQAASTASDPTASDPTASDNTASDNTATAGPATGNGGTGRAASAPTAPVGAARRGRFGQPWSRPRAQPAAAIGPTGTAGAASNLHRRRLIAVSALAVLAAAAIIVVLVLISDGEGSGPADVAVGRGGVGVPAESIGPDSGNAAGTNRAQGAAASDAPIRPADVPVGAADPVARGTTPVTASPGWVSYVDPDAGWSVAYPSTWQRRQGPGSPGNVDFVDPATGAFLRVGSVSQANTSAIGDWQRNEAGFVRSVQDYRRVRLAPSDGGDGTEQTDWEFGYRRSDGVMVHVLNRGVVRNGHGYALYWHTREDLWLQDQALMHQLFGAFRPGP